MTREELGITQKIFSAWEDTFEIEDAVGETARSHLRQARESLQAAFMSYTGRHPIEVRSIFDLNTRHPAEPWKSLKARN